MKKQLSRLVLAASLSVLAWSCNQKDPVAKGDYVQGVFVTTIGNFFDNNGGLSYFRREHNTAESDLFAKVNGSDLKGGVAAYTTTGERGLILVDNSNAGQDKVQIVDANSFEQIAAIGAPDIENPRDVVASGNKAYVSCWGTNSDYTYRTGYIAVIDLSTNKVTKKISIGNGPQDLVIHNGKLFIGTAAFGGGRTLTVMNTATDEIVKTVNFNAFPVPVGVDANGKIWISSGLDVIRMDPETYATTTLKIPAAASKFAENFAFSPDLKTLYFILSYYVGNTTAGEMYKFGIDDTQITTTTPFIKRYFSGLGVDPMQGLIYGAVTPSPKQSGYAIRYRSDGSLVDSVKVGIAPSGFYFR